MNKSNRFWFGLTIGALGGMFIAQKASQSPRMPNAKIWQRILSEKRGPIEAAVFTARVQRQYTELKTRRPIFEQTAFNAHVVGNILPGLALYEILREDGLDVKAALIEIDQLFEAWFTQYPPPNMRVNQLMKYTPQNFAVFQRLLRFVMDKFFPAPGWQFDEIIANEHTYAFNMQHCFYLDILNHYNAPELTPVFCKLDDILMAAMPESIQWGRTQTIGMGAEYCNFRWDYVPAATE
ncbi:MAG: L-2-amino-thiazoline-4-carboxylic acid hydrolase [Anaerolineae bacterium]|nr:L-2-amino-thiazoline-4-carboxylic acid hydrolase [Chloroflexota bacterium]MBT7072907.1 L-2-amino-thiazoline-4-carboxylic acid hydrolase [Anaerolineae bacterium]